MLQPGTCSAIAIVEQHVRRTARRARHALRHPRVVGRHDVRTAGADERRREHRLHQIGQPVGIDAHVGVGVGDDLAGGLGQTEVARGAEAAVRNVDDADAGVAPRAGAGVVARAVVDDDDLEVGVGERAERREAVVDRVGGVVGADHDRDLGPRRARPRARTARRQTPRAPPPAPASAAAPASTRPNAQSRTVCPPRHHSSVHENATAPHAPSANAARMWIAVMRAWPSAPSRMLSAPASASSSGRSPAMCCSRAR